MCPSEKVRLSGPYDALFRFKSRTRSDNVANPFWQGCVRMGIWNQTYLNEPSITVADGRHASAEKSHAANPSMHLRLKTFLNESAPDSYLVRRSGATNHYESGSRLWQLFGLIAEKTLRSRVRERDSYGDLMVRPASWSPALEHYEPDHRRIGKLWNLAKTHSPNFDLVAK